MEGVHQIAAAVRPGCAKARRALGETIMADLGMGQAWHPLMVRFGENTLRVFADRNAPDLAWPKTTSSSSTSAPSCSATRPTWAPDLPWATIPDARLRRRRQDAVAPRRRDLGAGTLTGTALYDRAVAEAQAMGWRLNLDVRGHRVADYPHPSRQAAGKLGDLAGQPSAGLWILEIQIRHPTLVRGLLRRPSGMTHSRPIGAIAGSDGEATQALMLALRGHLPPECA
jgi:hypothetical protein